MPGHFVGGSGIGDIRDDGNRLAPLLPDAVQHLDRFLKVDQNETRLLGSQELRHGAAYAAARTLGLAPKEIEKALHSFAGLPHRSQLVGERGGVRFVNDSKATNVDSAAKALQAFPKIRWIAGGLGKDGGIAGLVPYLNSVVKAYLIGHSARDFALELGQTPHEICETMERAVARAAEEAEAGEVVLLAPAAASFDQYPNFEKRGEDFTALVQALP